MDLRPYQREAVDHAFAAFAAGQRSTLFVCPTGGGKSLVFAEIIRQHLLVGKDTCESVLILSDREWLVTQAAAVVEAHAQIDVGVEMGIQRAGRGEDVPLVVSASVQSMVRRFKEFKPTEFDLIVLDEADLALAPSYRKILDYFSKAKIFGVTATPDRADGLAMGLVFESVCLDVDIRDLIDAGYLAGVRQWPVKVLDLSRVKVGDGDFDAVSLERVLLEERHLHEVVKPTMELAGDRPTLAFATSIVHAKALAGVFNRYRAGSARAVYGKMPVEERRKIVRAFVAREFQYLCNCNLLMRGVDVPPIACIAMARPTQSRTLYVQALGRGTRLSPETGKTDLLVLDFTDGADDHSLVSAIDVLGGRATAEECERARELLDEAPGGVVTDVLDKAKDDLVRDETIRERVRAKVKYRTREIMILDPIDWSVQPLGKVSDRDLGKMLKVHAHTVGYHRKALGIPAFRERAPIDWSVQPFGQVDDVTLGKTLGVSTTLVQKERARRGISKYRRVDWDMQPLGKVDDLTLANKLGVTIQAVYSARKQRKIPALKRRPSSRVNWLKQPLLGKIPDHVLAKQLGVSNSTVTFYRNKLNIQKCPRSEIDRKGLRDQLGVMSDKEIAKRTGLPISTVKSYRHKHDILPSGAKKKK